MAPAWTDKFIRYPTIVLAFCLLLVMVLSAGLGKLYFRGDYRIFFSEDNPQLLAFEQMQYEFNKSDNMLIGIAPRDRKIFTPERLELIRRYTEAAWQTPYSTRVDSITNYQHTEAVADDLLVADLVPAEQPLTAVEIARLQAVALNEPLLRNRLIAADGAVAAINITLQLPEQNQHQEVLDVWQAVTAISAQLQQEFPDVDFYHTGIIAMNYAFASEAEQDVKKLVPLMFLAILLVLGWLLRSVWASLATFVVIITSLLSTLGIAGWLGIFMSTATVNVPTILMTLAVADSVHIIASMQFALAKGYQKSAAVSYSLQRNLMPVLITSVTTAIGFLTLNFSEVPILRDLGNLTAIGVMLACLYSLVLLPILLLWLPMRPVTDARQHAVIQHLATWVIGRQQLLRWSFSGLVLLCLGLLTLNQINDEPNEYFAPATEFRQANDFMEQHLSGFTLIDFALDSGQPSGVNEPQFLSAVAAFSNWLLQQPEVMHVNTLTDIMKRLNKNMHQDDPAFYRLPESREEAAQYLLMYEMSLPFGLDLNHQLNIDKSATKLTATLYNLGSKELTNLESRAYQFIEQHYPQYQLAAASAGLMFAHIGERNMASMLKTLPLALILISVILIFSLGSLKLGLISLIPNLVPAIVGFGVWGLMIGEINLALSVVAGMSLGIIVDDTVHFLAKYKHARSEGLATERAVSYAFHSVGRALCITTLVLVCGFGVLIFSGFRLNSDMGLLTAMIILIALIVDLLFLPACLLHLDKDKDKSHVEETA